MGIRTKLDNNAYWNERVKSNLVVSSRYFIGSIAMFLAS